jgi:3-methyladenine DNA glycosylase/8-oxoguanine DNA glycosylase
MSSRGIHLQPIPEGAVEWLRESDPVLAALIDRVGPFQPPVEHDLWWSLVDAIISQQLSVKAAATISGRVAALGPDGERPTPAGMLALADDTLRAAGLSRAKVVYVQDLAAKWLDNTLEPDLLPALPDAEVVDHLTRVKGIGRWTAEMFLMFTLCRPDVLPAEDLGVRVAIQRAYDLPDRPGRVEMERIAEPWKPFRSAASFYLWRSLTTP